MMSFHAEYIMGQSLSASGDFLINADIRYWLDFKVGANGTTGLIKFRSNYKFTSCSALHVGLSFLYYNISIGSTDSKSK